MSLYSLAVRWRPQSLRSLSNTSLTSSYLAFGTPMENPVVNYRVTNLTNANLIISHDGIEDNDIVPANGYYLYDVSSNKGKGEVLALRKGEQLYVKLEDASATTGNVYLSTYYASNS